MRLLFRSLMIALAAAACFAQPPLRLTLADAQRLAIQNNPHITAASLNAAAAHQVPAQYHAGFEPSVAGSFTSVGADNGSRLAAGGLNNPVVYDRIGSGLSVGQLITDFGRTGNLVGMAKLQAEAQDQATETVADQVTALAESKLKSALDVSFANVNLADARLLQVQAQNEVKSAEANLATALGLPNTTGFILSEESMPPALPDKMDTLLQQALQDRPELKDLRLQQSADVRFAKAEHDLYFPSLGVVGTAGFVPAGYAAIPGRYGAIGLNVTIPVFNGGLFKARQTEAELKARAAAQDVSDLENRVTRDVRVAYLNAITAYDRLALTQQLLQQAQQALDLAQSRYDLGLGSIVELSQAQLNVTSAQIADATAHYDYQAQRVVVDFQTGALR